MSEAFDRSIQLTGHSAPGEAQQRFQALCLPFKADLFRFLFWLCRDRTLAEDLVQETLLRAWKSIDSLADSAAARGWLLTIARRELARVFERKRLATVDIETAADSEDPALSVTESHDEHDMRRAILKLEIAYREPLIMQVLLGFTTEEIARELELSVPAVLTRLFRARQLLRELLIGPHEGVSNGLS